MHMELSQYWHDLGHLARSVPLERLTRVADVLLDCYRRDGMVVVLGNGGSAATASHFVCDLVKGTRAPGLRPFRVIALTDNAALMTAWANDTSFERVFAEQLSMLARPGDVAVMISASGNSPNVLAAADAARQDGLVTVALTGHPGGRLARLADVAVRVPAASIEQVEDMHLAMTHSLCVALRARLHEEIVAQAIKHSIVDEEDVESTVADYVS